MKIDKIEIGKIFVPANRAVINFVKKKSSRRFDLNCRLPSL